MPQDQQGKSRARDLRQRFAAKREEARTVWRAWVRSEERTLPSEWKFMLEKTDQLSLRLRLFLALSTLDRPMPLEQSSTLERILSPWTQKQTGDPPEDWLGIVAKLLPQSSRSAAELKDYEQGGLHAVDNFLRWLDQKPPIVGSNMELLDANPGQLLGTKDGTRKTAYQEIKAFLASASGKPVLVVHQEAMQVGMTALAASLCKHLTGRGVTFVYLPLRPYGAPGEKKKRVTLPQLAAWLRAYYEGRKLATAAAVTGLQALRADLAAVRKAMTDYPAVIILDGHRSPGQRLPYLHAAMIDDPLLPLLEDLIHPKHAAKLLPPDPGITKRSRILVLSDQDIHHHKAFCREPLLFPLPAGKTLERLLTDLHGRAPPTLMTALEQADSCCSDVALPLFLRMTEKLPSRQWPTGIRWLYDAYCAQLEAENSNAMAALYLIAMTYDGLRQETLARLMGQMADCHALKALRTPWPRLDQAGMEAALRRLGADKMAEPVEEAGQDGERAVLHDIVASGLREAIVTRLFKRDKDSLVLAHRLIAEEALRQHTAQLAEADWLDRFDFRSLRRLYQFHYHAFLSLEGGPEDRLDRLEAVPRVLPAANEETYRRLYAVFFRMLMEEPAVMELSRVLGRDGLKADLLTVASRAGRPGFAKDVLDRSHTWSTDESGPFVHGHGWSARTPFRMVEAMVTDLRWNRARAEFSLRHPLPALPAAPAAEGNPGASARHKLALDQEIEKAERPGEYQSVIWSAEEQLHALGLTEDRQSAINHLVLDVVQPGFVGRVDAMVGDWARTCPEPARLAAWSDLLCRIGEARQLKAGLGRSSTEAASLLTEAFVNLFVAERLRRAAFDAGPLGRDYLVNGRSTRVFVRICLQLWLATRAAGGSAAFGTFLIGQADRHIDIVTRYFARFPSESAAIQVLRAHRERIVGYEDVAALRRARDWLERADEMMWYARDRQTVRMLLLLERCAVYRRLARMTDGADRDRFWAAARADGDHLTWMSSTIPSFAIWKRAADYTSRRLGKLDEELQALSGPP